MITTIIKELVKQAIRENKTPTKILLGANKLEEVKRLTSHHTLNATQIDGPTDAKVYGLYIVEYIGDCEHISVD